MLDGVFHHRLQNKMGHLGRKRCRFQFKRYRQPISEADLFNLKMQRRNSVSSLRLTSCWLEFSRVNLRKSPSRAIMLFAFGGSSKTSDEMECSVLKRKCG